MDLKFTGLKDVLKRFDENGWKGTFTQGDWQIGNGAYDCWFELYYRGEPVARCVAGELSCDFGLDDKQKLVLAQKIVEVYDNLKSDEIIKSYEQEYLDFLKEQLESKCNSDMCCEVYWDYRDEIPASTIGEVVDTYKERGYVSAKDYLIEKLEHLNFDYDSDMFGEIETELENCENEHVVDYFAKYGDLRDDAFSVGYNGLDVKVDEILRKSSFHVNVMFATAAERNFDMGSIVSAFGSWRAPDFEGLKVYPEMMDNGLTYFVNQQGHSVQEVYDCLLNNLRGFGSGDEMNFVRSVVNDIVNNSSDAMSEVTALVKLDGYELLELTEEVERGEKYLTFDKDTMMGIFNEWSGTGGLLEFELEKPFVVPVSMVRNVQIEGAKSDWGYTVDSVFGLIGSCWKETLGYTDTAPELYKDDWSAAVNYACDLSHRLAEEALADLGEVLADANEKAGGTQRDAVAKGEYGLE